MWNHVESFTILITTQKRSNVESRSIFYIVDYCKKKHVGSLRITCKVDPHSEKVKCGIIKQQLELTPFPKKFRCQ